MKQRIFAILLSLTLMFTLVPTAWAENNGITTEAVKKIYGSHVRQIILYGSYARGASARILM